MFPSHLEGQEDVFWILDENQKALLGFCVFINSFKTKYLIRSHGFVHIQVPQMVPNLIFSYSGQYLVLPVPVLAFCDLSGVARCISRWKIHPHSL